MKKITKQFVFIVSMIFLVTPILSACFLKTIPLYRVSLVSGAGGMAELKIGKTTLISGSSYKKGSKIDITVTTFATHTIKRVKAGSTILTADTVLQPSEGVTKATFTHKLTAEVALTVEFDVKDVQPPQPPPPDNCNNCGMCEECLELARDLVLPILDFILIHAFNGDNNALVIIAKAITDINFAYNTSSIKSIYLNAMHKLFADLMEPNCFCKACIDCAFFDIKGQTINDLIEATLEFVGDTELLVTIVEDIRSICAVHSAIDILEIIGKSVELLASETANDILEEFNDLDKRLGFFKDINADYELIMTEIIPVLADHQEAVLLLFARANTSLNTVEQSYVLTIVNDFYIDIAQSIVDGGFIKDGQEIAFKLAFLG